ncbi:MAG: DUF6089 family protein [Bacteroidia bacterium]
MERQPVLNSKANRRKLNYLVVLGLTMTLHLSVLAQGYFSGRKEYGVVFGVSNYYGDLSKGQNIKHFRPSFGVYQRYNMSDYFAWRNQISYLSVAGTTEGNPNYQIQNLNFQTDIYEISSLLTFDFHAFGTNITSGSQTPYAMIGLAGYHFNPYRLDASEISLRSANTEYRKKAYSRVRVGVPFGLGYKFRSSHKRYKGAWVFGIEAMWRKTYMDHLDDVSGVYPSYKELSENISAAAAQYSQAQTLNGGDPFPKGTFRGDASLDDWYYFYGFNLSYRFTPLTCR